MGITNNIKNMYGIVTVQIEGFFTERFINLCRINNVKIWEVRNIVKGIVRFKIKISDFKKLRKIARKTKCKVIIKNKEGLYFFLFKYRKRKFVAVLILLVICISIGFSTFIWNIDIEGNYEIKTEHIVSVLNENGLYVGKSKFGIDKKEIVNKLRASISDISWVGLEIDGTRATVKIVEKTKLADEDVQNTDIGDIISEKSGIISKIVVENGFAKYNTGSFIEKGSVIIEGKIYSKFIEPQDVPAKGLIRIKSEYEYNQEYKYIEIKKNYTGKKRITVGITINSKENMLNYLNKSMKYDITKKSLKFKLFGNEISLDYYLLSEYTETEIKNTKEDILKKAKQDSETYLKEVLLPNCKEAKVISQDVTVNEDNNNIILTTKFTIDEKIGEFVKRN